jgi:hypothetical protein
MTSRIRRTLLCASLAVLAVPTAAANAGEVAPPGAAAKGTVSPASRAAADPGCEANNVIAFRGSEVPGFRVRHSSFLRCSNIRVRIRCSATLLHEGEQISQIGDRGRDRCRVGTPFSESDLYPAGDGFTQNYHYKLTLLNRRQKWADTTRKCPRRKNERRTLICNASHSTTAPNRSTDGISS